MTLDDAAVERILRRAHELSQADDEGLDVATLVAAAEEAGLPAEAVVRSVADERRSQQSSAAPLDPLVGPHRVVADRLIEGHGDELLARLDEWFTVGHHLRRHRLEATEGEWGRRRDLAAGLWRRASGVRGGAQLGGEIRIIARVEELARGQNLVSLAVDRGSRRRLAVGAVGGAGVVTVATGSVLATLTPPLAVAALPCLALGAAAGAGSRRRAGHNQLELVRLLDQLARGERPRRLLAGS